MSNLEASITLKASVEQFAAGINSAAASFTGAMSRIEGAAENTGSKTEQSLAKVGIRRHAEIEAEISSVEDAYRQLAESGELTGRDLAQASLKMGERIRELHAQTNGWTESLGKMKVELAAAGAAIYGVLRTLKSAASQATDFSTAMAEVSTLLDDASDLNGLSDAVRKLALEFGGDVTEKAGALYQIISAGAADSATAIDTLTAANKLAIGGVTDIKTAADGLTSAMNAYGDAAGSATTVSDAFFVAVKAGKTDVAQLSASIGQVAPIASEAGVSLEELLASVATLTSGGVKTAEAMTQIRGALTGIIKPTADAAKTAEQLGLRFDATTLKAKGWAAFLDDVQRATGGNVETMGRLFGSVEGLNAVLTLTGRGAEKLGQTLEQMAEKSGQTEIAFTKMGDSPAQAQARFAAAMHEVQITLGELVLAATPALNAVTALIRGVGKMSGGAKTAVVALGALAVALPPLIFAVGSFSKAFVVLRAGIVMATGATWGNVVALRALRAAMIATGIGALVVGVGVLAEKLFASKDAAVEAAEATNGLLSLGEQTQLDEALASVKASLAGISSEAAEAGQQIRALPEADTSRIVEQFDALVEKGSEVKTALKEIAEHLQFGDAQGVSAFQLALAELVETGKISAAELEAAWATALTALDGGKLNAFALNAKAAFEDGKLTAEEFAAVNERVLVESFRRLGVSAVVALGGISDASQEAIDAVDRIAQSLTDAKIGAEKAGPAIEAALTKAFAVADNLPALEQMVAQLEALGRSGQLGAAAMSRLADEAEKARARIEDLTPGIQSVDEAFRKLGVTSQAAFTRAAGVAKESFEKIRTSGKATERELRESFQAYATAAIAANEGVADKTLVAQARLYGLAIEADETGKSIVVSMDDAKKAVDKVAESSDSAADSMRGIGDAAAAAAGAVQSSAQAAGQSVGDFAQGARVEFLSAIDMLSNHASEALKIAERIYEAALLRGKSIEAAYKMARRAAREYIAEMEEIEAREERAARRREQRERRERGGGGIPAGGTGQIRAPGAGARPPGWSEPPPPAPEPERPAPQPPRLPPPPPPTQPTPPGNVTINIAGILDVHDRATLDGLARKLQPVLAELLRKGVR